MTNDSQAMLFPKAEIETLTTTVPPAMPRERPCASPRLNKPERLQAEMRCESLDQRLDADHIARVVWQLVQGLDLSSLCWQNRLVSKASSTATNILVLFALASVALSMASTAAASIGCRWRSQLRRQRPRRLVIRDAAVDFKTL